MPPEWETDAAAPVRKERVLSRSSQLCSFKMLYHPPSSYDKKSLFLKCMWPHGFHGLLLLLLFLFFFPTRANKGGFPCGSAGKESARNVGDLGSILGLGRSPGEGKGYPLQYSGLEISTDCTVHGVTKSWTWLSDFQFTSGPTKRESNHAFLRLYFSLVAEWHRIFLLLQETLVQSLGWEDPLEEGMATHFSILAWRNPWTEEPGGLQSMGSQRIRHD